MITWTEEQLAIKLEQNPALRINEKYSTPARKGTGGRKAPRVARAEMKFYQDEQQVRIVFPFVYPSLNKILRMNRWERKRTEDEFRDMVRWTLIELQVLGFRSPVALDAIIYHSTVRRRDRDNYCMKWLKDALKGIVIIDDEPKYVAGENVDFKPGKPRTELKITPIKELKL